MRARAARAFPFTLALWLHALSYAVGGLCRMVCAVHASGFDCRGPPSHHSRYFSRSSAPFYVHLMTSRSFCKHLAMKSALDVDRAAYRSSIFK